MVKKFSMILALCLMLSGCRAAPPQTTATQPVRPSATAATQPPTTQPQFRFPETVLADTEYCTVTVRSIDPDGTFGYTLQVLLENKTQLDLMFSLRGVSVNGYMCDPFFAATVSAGMKSNEEISFLKSDLAANGITEVTDITFTLAVYDSTDILAEYLMEEEFTVYPQGEEAQRTYERQSAQTDVVLVSNEECAIIVTGFEPDSTWGYAMGVYLENRTDEALMFSASDVAVNGYMCDPYWAVEVAPGKRCNCQITWSKTDLADNGITQVERITLPIRVYDSDDWLEGEILSETFTITP